MEEAAETVKPGDIIIFDSVSRMARDAEEGFEEYQKLYAMGVELIFLQEPHINTEVYRNALQICIPEDWNECRCYFGSCRKVLDAAC